ncbi:MAG: hypothetical protein F4Y28_13140 [Acidimicrobiia bacterium]|nr:hypothetical protein [Acidimicrobiia bacterium]MYG59057.1 hypothetical protein [Acidimicrobiia bacterium]MYJ33191.1 hypothetical protein [Acidimicrobiia bacterium]
MAASPKAKFAPTTDMQALSSSDHSSFVLELLADLISFRSPDEERVVYQREQNEASPSDSDDSQRPRAERVALLVDAFLERLSSARRDIDEIDPDEARNLGIRAAEDAIASARWSRLVGDRIDTSEAAELLGVTRQALSKRQTSGSLLGLPGRGTTWYPTWQLDIDKKEIRSEVRQIIGAFRDSLGKKADPFLIASWASTAQHEDLGGLSPAEWLARGNDLEDLRQAAQRTAERLAQ